MHEPRPVVRHDGNRAVVMAVAVLAAAVVLLGAIALLAPRLDPLDRAERERQAARDAAAAEVLQPLDMALYAAWRALPLVLVAAAATVALRVAWRRWGHPESVRAAQVIAALKAQHAPVPQSLTYSPHWSNRSTGGELLPDLGAVAALPAPPVPAFGQLLASGEIGEGRPLVLGVDVASGELVRGDFRSLYSSGLGGLQGSGKTWTAAALLAQSALQGARIVCCDPHAGDDESLAARVHGLGPAMLCGVADDDRSILEALRLVADELDARKHGRSSDRTPIILAIDEWLSLRRGAIAEVLPQLVEGVTTEGRKLQIHALLLAQRWDKSAAGDFRNTLASAYVHRLRPAEARMLTGLSAEALPGDTLQLQPGQAYLLDTRGDVRKVSTLRMTVADVAEVGRQLGSGHIPRQADGPPAFGFRPAPSVATNQPRSSHDSADDYSAPQRRAALSPEALRVVTLFLSGKDAGAIVTELTGMTSKAGRPYLVELARVQEIIRQALAGAQS